jgi:hypothetical protein
MELERFGGYLLRKEREANILVVGEYEVIINDKAARYLEEHLKYEKVEIASPKELLKELSYHKGFKIEPLWFYFCRQVASCGKKEWFNEA